MNILGLTHPTGADCAACLICDGVVIGVYEEERFSRQKHSRNTPPFAALDRLFRQANCGLDDVEAVVVGLTRPRQSTYRNARLDAFLGDMQRIYDHYDDQLAALGSRQERVDHYVAHAFSVAPYFTGRAANLMILDGWGGDWAGAAMSLSANGEMRELWRVPVTYSLGLFYQAVTARLGFQAHADEGKTMGLAAYGEIDEASLPDFCDAATGLPELTRYLEFFERSGARRAPHEELTDAHRRIAATAQYYLERAVLQSAQRIWRETGCSAFGLAGGVALNCVANGKLANADFVSEVVVTPVANDAGIALGAAIGAARTNCEFPSLPMDHAFLGPGYDTNQIDVALNFAKLTLEMRDPVAAATEALLEGKVVGVYQGRAEIGPRALGARSILADPRRRAMRDRVNRDVKRREPWRPFAPVTLDRYAKEIFGVATPFMTIADKVDEAWRGSLEAVVHEDGTARAQILPAGSHLMVAEIVERFGEATGVPVLLNTSFNLSDEPMVERPDHAIATFFRSGMDMLAFEHGVLVKR